MSSRSGGARGAGPTTGPSAPTRTPGRRRGGGTPGSSTTPARRARTSGKGAARGRTRASTRTGCSSAGSTRPATGPSRARTGPRAGAGSASSRTRRTSLGCCRRAPRRRRWSRDGSPMRQSQFLMGATPPMSPSGESQPPSAAVNELLSSLRKMQLEKVKSMPPTLTSSSSPTSGSPPWGFSRAGGGGSVAFPLHRRGTPAACSATVGGIWRRRRWPRSGWRAGGR
ncbi:putative zinc finger CCCH domain-containing protein 2 [Iris pallida]|uniref:Zinc finger CCCH domain-containing protein 2 n=1 Tax=Iris pallida TaxID=29817 RepID=A0AAX6ELI9_IRIPA|nr:putative zinc finger CCCH domain-containing protein 2 [Iris pallida]